MTEKDELLTENNAEIERLKAVIEDYKTSEEEIAREMDAREGSEIIELSLGDGIGDKTYDDGDIDKLLDASIRFDGEMYDIFENIITTSDMKVSYSLIDDEEFGSIPYITTNDRGSLEYRYVFDDTIDIDDISRDEPLTILFLGKDMVITNVDTNEFEIRVGDSIWLDVNEQTPFNEHTIVVDAVTEDGDGAGIIVDNELRWIDTGDEYEFGDVTIAVEDVKVIHSDDNSAAVKLIISDTENNYQTFEDGDSIIYDEDENDAEFIYTLSVVADELTYIGVQHNQKMDELDDDFIPLKETEKIVFPNEYITLEFDSTNIDEYNKISVEFDDVEDESGNEFDGVVFEGDDEKSFEIDGEDTDTIYAWTIDNGTSWVLSYLDDDDDVIDATDDTFKMKFEDTEYDVAYDGDLVTIDLMSIDIETDGTDFVRLGNVAEDAETSDIQYNLIDIGTRDEDVLCTDGLIILNPEDNADEDIVEFMIPEDEEEITLKLG